MRSLSRDRNRQSEKCSAELMKDLEKNCILEISVGSLIRLNLRIPEEYMYLFAGAAELQQLPSAALNEYYPLPNTCVAVGLLMCSWEF